MDVPGCFVYRGSPGLASGDQGVQDLNREIMSKAFEKLRDATTNNLWFCIFSTTAIGLLIASFILPPAGAIDPSVIGAVGEIFAFASLWTLIKALDKGVGAKVEHNGTSVTIGDDSKEEDEP